MKVDKQAVEAEFQHFKARVKATSGGDEWISFRHGPGSNGEAYKLELRERARKLLGTSAWKKSAIGTGAVLKSVVSAIEVHATENAEANNLVEWRNKYGHAARSHTKLLDAISEGETRDFEQAFFDLYCRGASDAESFERIRTLAGSRYDLVSYLFFLKDAESYMPVRAKHFDDAFERLGIDLRMSRRCSWENYAAFNDALREVASVLVQVSSLDDVRLVDAHSFCWMLVNPPDLPKPASERRARSERDRGRALDNREISIIEMASMAEQTTRRANGQKEERTLKSKELRMTRVQLEKFIAHLLDKQENRCNLTGIPLRFAKDGDDLNLRPSLDRIDSAGHYEAKNLQVVCRFINFWKGASSNAEFCRLLNLVRTPGDADEQ